MVSAHKSVAVLGVIGWAEEMHSILDAETEATLGFLDDWVRGAGGRRGRAAAAHADGRAGVCPDPACHVAGRGSGARTITC